MTEYDLELNYTVASKAKWEKNAMTEPTIDERFKLISTLIDETLMSADSDPHEFCTVCGKPTLLVQRFGEISTALCERCASDPRIGEPELVEEAKRIRDKRVTYD